MRLVTSGRAVQKMQVLWQVRLMEGVKRMGLDGTRSDLFILFCLLSFLEGSLLAFKQRRMDLFIR